MERETLPEFIDYEMPLQQTPGQYRRNKEVYKLYRNGMRTRDLARQYKIHPSRVPRIIETVKKNLLFGGAQGRKARLPEFEDYEPNARRDEKYERNKAIYISYRSGTSAGYLAKEWNLSKTTVETIINRIKLRLLDG